MVMKWLDFDPERQEHGAELLSHVRFETIPASELVSEVQPVARMMQDPQCHRLLVKAMNYHLLPHQQNAPAVPSHQRPGGPERAAVRGGAALAHRTCSEPGGTRTEGRGERGPNGHSRQAATGDL